MKGETHTMALHLGNWGLEQAVQFGASILSDGLQRFQGTAALPAYGTAASV